MIPIKAATTMAILTIAPINHDIILIAAAAPMAANTAMSINISIVFNMEGTSVNFYAAR
jgi:hypothetical protein